MFKRYFPYTLPLFLSACFLLPAEEADAHHHHHHEKKHHHHSHARYTPPGPPSDPWGPYIQQASRRFDIPASWIRGVIRQESGGKMYNSRGELIRSSVGAMGLMQLMPSAYHFLREQYHLGNDPFDPYNNIMAGTGYIRQLYEVYGSPGFLAAYNAGPGRVDHYLKVTHSLPPETRNYVASISRYLRGHHPHVRSRTDLLVTKFNGTPQEQWEATYMLQIMKHNQNLIDTRYVRVPPKPKPKPKPVPKRKVHPTKKGTPNTHAHVASKAPVKTTGKKVAHKQDDAYKNIEHALSLESGSKRTPAASKISRHLESVPNRKMAPEDRSKKITRTHKVVRKAPAKRPVAKKTVTPPHKAAGKTPARKIVKGATAKKVTTRPKVAHKVAPKKTAIRRNVKK